MKELNGWNNELAQADKGDQFQFISIRNEKTEWNWTKYDAIEAGVMNETDDRSEWIRECYNGKWMVNGVNLIQWNTPIQSYLIEWCDFMNFINNIITVIRAD